MEAREVRASPVRIEFVQRFLNVRLRRVPEAIDRLLRLGDPIKTKGRDDGDESVAHGDHRSKRSGR